MIQKNVFYLFVFMVCLLGQYACKTKQVITEPQTVTPLLPQEFPTTLIINYKLVKDGIRDTFNRAIASTFQEDFDIPQYDLKIKLSKPKDASVEIENKNILTVVPITVYMEKSTFLAKLKAVGTVEMSFNTSIDIDSFWNMKTLTEMTFHRWIEKPKLNVGGLNVPIEAISDAVIKRTKSMIAENIDYSIKESFSIREKMKETMAMFDDPMFMGASEKGWLSFKPEKIFLTGTKNNRFTTNGKIGINAISIFSSYKPAPLSISKFLPSLEWKETLPDTSNFKLLLDIKMEDINRLLEENLKGKTFANEGKKVTIENIITSCDPNFLTVNAEVSGSTEGTIVVKGKPYYDPAINSFYMKDIDIMYKTKNILHKAASWIAQGKIKNEIKQNMTFDINKNVLDAQKSIDNQLKSFKEEYDIDLKMIIGRAEILKHVMQPDQIQAVLSTNFYLEARIRDFRSFNKFGEK